MVRLALLNFLLATLCWTHTLPAIAKSNLSLSTLRKSVLKIRTISVEPDYRNPWKYFAAQASFGSGFYIGNKMIMTNAHVVANHRFISVQKDGDSQHYEAKVLYVADDCDLAILTVKDESYFQNLPALTFGAMPKLQSPVEAVGYPRGGDQISITEGVVSRIDYRVYAHTNFNQHILVQVDSAINPGNSGGPVIQYGQVIGVAFQEMSGAQNTGYIIPTPLVQRFLKDIKDGKYDGTPIDGITTQPWSFLNPDAREFFGLKGEGELVTHVNSSGMFHNHIQPNDVIMNIDGHNVGIDGKVYWHGERVNFRVLIDMKLPGDSIKFKILRNREIKTVEVTIIKNPPFYYGGKIFERFPPFYMVGGLIFTKLSLNLLGTFTPNWALDSPIALRYLHGYFPLKPLEYAETEAVILVDRLPHPVNTYVDTPMYSIVRIVNGKPVRTLADMIAIIEASTEDFLKIDYYFWTEPTIFKKDDAMASQAQIASLYKMIPQKFAPPSTEERITP